ncbi:hypothetical protein Brsp01_26400 [Brucella sp. NBRC 12950]|nr:hypothetical protein Brsp01_26400 [Brucella sp. NBRC 12950]
MFGKNVNQTAAQKFILHEPSRQLSDPASRNDSGYFACRVTKCNPSIYHPSHTWRTWSILKQPK